MNSFFSIKNLEILFKVVECENISEAARQLNISPSSISKILSHLEDELGVTLFNRTTRSIKITEAGEYLIEKSQGVLLDFEEILNTTAGYNHKLRGKLKLTSSVAFGYAHLVSIVDQYREIAPDVNMEIDLNDDFVNLNGSNIDIALRITSVPPLNYATKKLADIRWVYCASKEYLENKEHPKTREDLLNHCNLVYPGLTPEIKSSKNYKHRPRVLIQANSGLLILKSVLEHQGIAYLPTYLVGEHILKGNVIPLTIDNELTHSTHALYALYFPSKYVNPKIRSFIDFTVLMLQPKPCWEAWEKQYKQ